MRTALRVPPLVAAAAVALACGGGDDATQTTTAGCATAADLCIGRSGPVAQVQAEMALCTPPVSTAVPSCPTQGLVGGCRRVEGQLVETTWFYVPTWTAQSAAATCAAPDVWVPAP